MKNCRICDGDSNRNTIHRIKYKVSDSTNETEFLVTAYIIKTQSVVMDHDAMLSAIIIIRLFRGSPLEIGQELASWVPPDPFLSSVTSGYSSGRSVVNHCNNKHNYSYHPLQQSIQDKARSIHNSFPFNILKFTGELESVLVYHDYQAL